MKNTKITPSGQPPRLITADRVERIVTLRDDDQTGVDLLSTRPLYIPVHGVAAREGFRRIHCGLHDAEPLDEGAYGTPTLPWFSDGDLAEQFLDAHEPPPDIGCFLFVFEDMQFDGAVLDFLRWDRHWGCTEIVFNLGDTGRSYQGKLSIDAAIAHLESM